MGLILTHFARSDAAAADTAERAANFCLAPLRTAFGRTVTIVNENLFQQEASSNGLLRLVLAVVSIVLLPLTLIGMIFAAFSGSARQAIQRHVELQAPPPPPPDNPNNENPPPIETSEASSTSGSPKTLTEKTAAVQGNEENSSEQNDPALLTPAKTSQLIDTFHQVLNSSQSATPVRRDVDTLRRDAPVKWKDLTSYQEPTPENFAEIITEFLDKTVFGEEISAELQEKYPQNIPALILREAGLVSKEELARYAAVLFFCNRDCMHMLLMNSRDEDSLRHLATALCPKAGPNGEEILLRELFLETITDKMLRDNALKQDKVLAGKFLSYCDPQWVAGECGSNAWTAFLESCKSKKDLAPLQELVQILAQTPDLATSREPRAVATRGFFLKIASFEKKEFLAQAFASVPNPKEFLLGLYSSMPETLRKILTAFPEEAPAETSPSQRQSRIPTFRPPATTPEDKKNEEDHRDALKQADLSRVNVGRKRRKGNRKGNQQRTVHSIESLKTGSPPPSQNT